MHGERLPTVTKFPAPRFSKVTRVTRGGLYLICLELNPDPRRLHPGPLHFLRESCTWSDPTHPLALTPKISLGRRIEGHESCTSLAISMLDLVPLVETRETVTETVTLRMRHGEAVDHSGSRRFVRSVCSSMMDIIVDDLKVFIGGKDERDSVHIEQ